MAKQAHNKFKVYSVPFSGSFDAKTKKPILAFVNQEGVSAKSVGIEFLESSSRLVISIGYAVQKKNTSKYDLTIKSVGKHDFSGEGFAELDKVSAAFEKTAGKLENIICHEFFITGSGEAFAIFLTEK
jgi:hypothetical protein